MMVKRTNDTVSSRVTELCALSPFKRREVGARVYVANLDRLLLVLYHIKL
jgi:hypothetical protein